MSAELCSTSAPDGNDASVRGTRVGGSKPLHRFMKGQPKIVGVFFLILGTSFFIISISIAGDFSNLFLWSIIHNGLLQGVLLVICGILYIVTEHYPTKKTVTISLALSIVTILATCWTLLHILSELGTMHYYRFSFNHFEENATETETLIWTSYYENMVISLEVIFVLYSFVTAIIVIVMSSMAGAALRSTKSQAIVVMTAAAPETPAE